MNDGQRGIKIAPLLLSLPLMALVYVDYRMSSADVEGFRPAVGTVVQNIETRCQNIGGRSRPCWVPVVEYVAPDGRRVRNESSVARRPKLLIGSQVEVLVNPRQPDVIKLGGASGHWFRFTVVSAVAMAFALVAILYSLFGHKLEKL